MNGGGVALGAVVGALREDARRGVLADADSLVAAHPAGDQRERPGVLVVELRSQRGIERDQTAVRGSVDRRGHGGVAGRALGREVGAPAAIDRDRGVVDRGVDDGEAAGRVDGRRLRPRRTQDAEQDPVPRDHGIARGWRGRVKSDMAGRGRDGAGRRPGQEHRGRRAGDGQQGQSASHENLLVVYYRQ